MLRRIVITSSNYVLSPRGYVIRTSSTVTSKSEYYKQIHENENTNPEKPAGWDEAKPFEEMPGPKPLPFLGNGWRMILGELKSNDLLEFHQKVYDKYGKISSMRQLLPGQDFVVLFDSNDFEMLFRNEGVWPVREGLKSMVYYRKVLRKEVYGDMASLLVEQGEKWAKFRTTVNPILMQPRIASQYVGSMDKIGDEFIEKVRKFAKDDPKNEMPRNFENELNKWALESIGVMALDRRLGCLDLVPNPEAQLLITNVLQLFELMYELDIKNPLFWPYFSTPTYRKFVKCHDYITNITLKYVEESFQKIQKRVAERPENEKSALEKMVKINKQIAFNMAMDMLMAGIDTTSKAAGAALYYLARNPRTQEKLREELRTLLPGKTSPITKDVLSSASYLKATIKESLRLTPISVGNVRKVQKDLVLHGYQVPKGVNVVTNNMIVARRDFPNGDEFLPERWLRSTQDEFSHRNVNPFTSLPFGFGPRSCVGKRLANLEMEILVAKVIRNFSLEWHYPEMRFRQLVIYGFIDPLRLTVKDIDN